MLLLVGGIGAILAGLGILTNEDAPALTSSRIADGICCLVFGAVCIGVELRSRSRQQRRSAQLDRLRPQLEPIVTQFVTTMAPDVPLPSITISDTDVQALATQIPARLELSSDEEQLDPDGLLSLLRELVIQEIQRQEVAAFRQHIGMDSVTTLPQLVDAYVDSFGASDSHLPHACLCGREIERNLTLQSLRAQVEAARQSQVTRRRGREIMRAMENRQHLKSNTWSWDDIDQMSGRDFEVLLGELFAAMGYSVTVTPPAGDQGADLILQGREGTIAVQAKRYSGSVGNTAVQEVVAAKAFYQCVFAWIVCTSDYTRSAHALAQANEVDLWDRQKLNDALRRFGVLKNDKP